MVDARNLLINYLGAVAGVCLATLGTIAIHPWTGNSVSMLFFPAVVIPAMFGGYGPTHK